MQRDGQIIYFLPLCLLRDRRSWMGASGEIGDKKGREHILEIQLKRTYPKCPPSISAHLEKLQEFWSILEDIDKSLWVDDMKASFATSYRQINIGNDSFIMLSINASDPRSLPEIRFLGSGPSVNVMRKTWQKNSKRWKKEKPFLENLASLLETHLPGPPDVLKRDQQVECGICYAQNLPIDDELGNKSGCGTDYTCDNTNCSRAFHSICLGDWLRSITTTRQSFNVLFGNCPYCSEPIAVKINSSKQ
ncbi:uncharacterized protein LOC107424969 isoform X5 [Ziziphus jujuba]|uniref:Uncharacterized protein LOC107424969 isoform X5 n=1 Tax=Ziziphus jujuba TaxID=326968 RepID=A0A6P6GCK0_ZIZJJ|nr:uncharacterized protein LOC107424969 isoform X5 [Ziziphus jujuba]